jgi:thiamine kinase-like enzyme
MPAAPESELEAVRAVLRRAALDDSVATVARLPSVSNRVYLAGELVVRLPTRSRCAVDHHDEADSSRQAAAIDLAPATLFLDFDDGAMVRAFVNGSALSPALIRADPTVATRSAVALRCLHDSSLVFRRRFDPFAAIDMMLTKLHDDQLAAVRRAIEPVRVDLSATAPPPRPCHNDPWPGNLIDTGAAVVLLDWEYAGMNDPAWDLADLVVEADLDEGGEYLVIAAYGGDDPRLTRRVALHKPVVDLFWSVWSRLELAAGNTADDFAAAAERRLVRAQRCLLGLGLEHSA